MGDPHVEDKPSFWTTVPGIITGIGGLITAVAVLIGALNAAGIIGSDGDTPADPSGSVTPTGSISPTPTTSPTGSAYPDAVINGEWAVRVKVQDVDGDPGENMIWSFQDPQDGDTRNDTWFMESGCPTDPCTTSWESPDTPRRFDELTYDGDGYDAFNDLGTVACLTQRAQVTRRMRLNVTDQTVIDGVPRATEIGARIEISWTCDSDEISGILTAHGERVDI